MTSATSAPIALSAGADHQLAFATPPAVASSGVAMSPFTVSVLDASGKPDQLELTPITLFIANNSGAIISSSSGLGPVNAVNGVATFTPTVSGTVGSLIFIAESGSLVSTNATTSLAAGPDSQLAIFESPQTATASGRRHSPNRSRS